MATIATTRKRARFGRKWLIGIGVVIVLIVGALLVLPRGNVGTAATATPGWQTVAATNGTIDAAVSATGNIEAQAQADLRFATDGLVTAILVKPGDKVQAGQPLARVDDVDLKLRVEQSQADLKQAQADLQKLSDKATPQEIDEAQARVAQAQGQYTQAVGSVTPADIAAAKARLAKAQDRLKRLQSGTVSGADADVAQAQTTLEQARTDLAAAKERARLDMETAANSLRNRQDSYTRIYWDNRKLEGELARFGQALPQESVDQEKSALRDVNDAEAALAKAQIAYEDAKKNEIATIQAREADVRKAQTGSSSDLLQAQADVQSAQAELAKLTGGNQAGNVASAQANLDIAQAQLAKLSADPNASDLARAQASVARSEAALKQAQYALDQATLVAPFAATIARIDLRVGERPGQTGLIAIADLSKLQVSVPVDELDVAQIKEGQSVKITLDALPDKELAGTVVNIDPLATKSDKGTNTYKVTVAIDTNDAAVRPGMTAIAQIVTQHKDNVVLVPRRAVQSENGQSFVLAPTDGPPDPKTQTPANEHRPVTLGLSNSEFVEITGGLKADDKILVKDVVSTFNPIQ
jgi:RND family efflux transporter MFP subunit